MTFHSLLSLLFSQFTRSSEKGKAVIIADCSTFAEFLISADAVYNTRAVVWPGKGENQEDKGLLSLNLRRAQVLVAAVSKIRWFVFGFRISSLGPTGEKPLFMHPKVTTLSFLCHRGDGKGKRDLMQGSGSERWVGDDLQGISLAAGRSWAPFKMAAAAAFKGPF